MAATGETAPGLDSGYIFESLDPGYTIGASGQSAFSGSANIKRGATQDRKQALWFGLADALKPVAMVGDTVGGSGEAVLINGFASTPRVITRSGRLGFVVATAGSQVGKSAQALLVHDDNRLIKAIAAGDPVPMPAGNTSLLHISQFAMTDAGILFMGKYARNRSGLWFWDYEKLTLVIADQTMAAIGPRQCNVRSVGSTTLDINEMGVALFRVSLGGNDCARGGIVAWDARSNKLLPVAMTQAPLSGGSESYFQSVTGDARVGDRAQVALHANVYSTGASASGAKEMTLMQPRVGGATVELLDTKTPLSDAPEIGLTHAIVGDGLAVVNEHELVHFVRNNRDRLILRTTTDGGVKHSVLARNGTSLVGEPAVRIGDAHVNRNGDVVFTSFIDDGPKGGNYQQELWFLARNGNLTRLAYPGQSVTGRTDQTIERIDSANQSHEPKMRSTQGGRGRVMDDSGAVVFSGRLRKSSQSHNALFIASPH